MWKWPEGKRFAPGHRPWNWRPVGAERIVDNGILVKVPEANRWRFKHLVEWEAAHGQIPQGLKIVFVDGNRFNCSLDNLKAVPRIEATEKIGGNGFIYVKEAEGGKWQRKHLVVWESAFGPVPPKYTLLFADGNPQNCEIENLIIAPKSLKKRKLFNMQGLSLLSVGDVLDSLGRTHHQLTAVLNKNLLSTLGFNVGNKEVKDDC